MKLEQQVTSLALSRRLKELGVKQESLFYIDEQDLDIIYGSHVIPTFTGHTFVSAFTVPELGEMLPIEYISQRRPHGSLGAKEDVWCAGKYDEDYLAQADTEADARGKCLIYLLENKLIKP